MKFRIGQKVRILQPSEEHCSRYGKPMNIGVVGKIIKWDPKDEWAYTIKFNSGEELPYFELELESIFKVGEQLLFDFMKE